MLDVTLYSLEPLYISPEFITYTRCNFDLGQVTCHMVFQPPKINGDVKFKRITLYSFERITNNVWKRMSFKYAGSKDLDAGEFSCFLSAPFLPNLLPTTFARLGRSHLQIPRREFSVAAGGEIDAFITHQKRTR